MKKSLALASFALLTLALSATPALAGCAICVDSVTAHTRDGESWKSGQPVMLLFDVSRPAAETAFPETGEAVVMVANRDRVKCLNVPLKKTAETGGTAQYAGVFYPFYDGRFEGKVAIGTDTGDFSFEVGTILPATPVTRSTEVPAAPREEVSTTPVISLDSAVEALPLALLALLVAAVPLALRPRLLRQS